MSKLSTPALLPPAPAPAVVKVLVDEPEVLESRSLNLNPVISLSLWLSLSLSLSRFLSLTAGFAELYATADEPPPPKLDRLLWLPREVFEVCVRLSGSESDPLEV